MVRNSKIKPKGFTVKWLKHTHVSGRRKQKIILQQEQERAKASQPVACTWQPAKGPAVAPRAVVQKVVLPAAGPSLQAVHAEV
jgi:hypothetical protein